MTRQIWQKWDNLCRRIKERVSPSPDPSPAYESSFRLSKAEVQLIEIIIVLGVPAAISSKMACEWGESLRLGDQYPFRPEDPSLVCSIQIGEMFKYLKDWEVQK